MQYRIEFLNEANSIVREVHSEASSRTKAFLLAVEKDWPPDAMTACAVDKHRAAWAFRLQASDKVRAARPEACLEIT